MNKLFVDGYTIGSNPSRVGGGFVICDEDSKVIEQKKIIKPYYTNNEAEISGLVKSLELIDDLGTIYTDSFIACCWLRGGRAKARPDLNGLIKTGHALQKKKDIKIIQINRAQNLAGIYIENCQLEGKKFY